MTSLKRSLNLISTYFNLRDQAKPHYFKKKKRLATER